MHARNDIRVHARNDIRVPRRALLRAGTSDDSVLAGLLFWSIVKGEKGQTLARAPLDALLRPEDEAGTHASVWRNPIGIYRDNTVSVQFGVKECLQWKQVCSRWP